MSAKNVSITVAGDVVASAGFINWTQGSGMTYTVSLDFFTDYISVSEASSGSGDTLTLAFSGNVA